MRNLTGQTFGFYTVIEYAGLTGGGQKKKYGIHKGYHTWLCECQCGTIKCVREVKLLAGTTKSCGCLKTVFPPHTLPKGEAAKNWVFNDYKQSAKKRGLFFSLSKEELLFITSQKCHYCGEAPHRSAKRGHIGNSAVKSMNGDYIYNGIDRVDNNIGYILSNCVPCCWKCNELKKAKTYDHFLEHIWKIAKNLKLKD